MTRPPTRFAGRRHGRRHGRAATGSAIGEGGGLFIIEELDHARKRGAKIYAELVGFGASQDSYKIDEPDPSGHAYAKAVAKAMAEADVDPAQVDCLVPHGLGIPAFDRAELAGLANVFGEERLAGVPLAPIKAQTGNLAAGSGMDAAAAVLAIHHGRIPPAINTRHVMDGRSLNVAAGPREQAVKVAVSSVYSLGGQNAALVFRKI